MRRVKILSNSYIVPITMDGPIVSPITIDDKTVYDIVRRGYNVIEVNENIGKSVKLTTKNFNDPNRFNDLIPEKPVFTPTGSDIDGVATPVVPISSNITTAPTPAAVNKINESKNLSRAERKAKRREEEAARKAAEKAAAEAAVTETPVEQPVEETAPVVEEPAAPVETVEETSKGDPA